MKYALNNEKFSQIQKLDLDMICGNDNLCIWKHLLDPLHKVPIIWFDCTQWSGKKAGSFWATKQICFKSGFHTFLKIIANWCLHFISKISPWNVLASKENIWNILGEKVFQSGLGCKRFGDTLKRPLRSYYSADETNFSRNQNKYLTRSKHHSK